MLMNHRHGQVSARREGTLDGIEICDGILNVSVFYNVV
jgi:hypothetical protein